MSNRLAAMCVLVSALVGFAILALLTPEYLTSRGFPLDDAWIHAVYGRSLARSAMLAYNPGIPATGATSPLWAAVLAIPHLLWSSLDAVLAGIKLIGFALHAVTALLFLRAFAGPNRVELPAAFGAMLVAFHPDLVSASISGMEVPLSTALAVIVLLAARAGSFTPYFVVSAVAPMGRPELALLCFAIPAVLYARTSLQWAVRLISAAALGTALSFVALGLRNVAASGRPLPATFYAKAGSGGLSILASEQIGFSRLLGELPVADSSILLTATAVAAFWLAITRHTDAGSRLAAAAFLGALAFCAVSFVLVQPIDPGAFYHQRYVLPALPLLIGALPLLLDASFARFLPSDLVATTARAALLLVIAASLLIDAPSRYLRLDNDARNVDDVQVAVGKSLAAAPDHEVVWAVDAGAVRYFGSPFVVDLIGLNNGELLGPDAQAFLDAHAPRFIELVPDWSSLDADSMQRLRGRLFRPSTPYTLTGFPAMQQHLLVSCEIPSVTATLRVRSRIFTFECAT